MAHHPQHAAIAVLGAGSWGTALAIQLARTCGPTILWGRNAESIRSMQETRENRSYLAGIPFPTNLYPEPDLEWSITHADDLLISVPSHAFRKILVAITPFISSQTRIAWATKGLEPGSHKLLHQVAQEVLGKQASLAVVSGPTFAREVALGLPTAVTVAANESQFAHELAARLHGGAFRPYTSNDLVGVGIGGAVKNVLAIAAGIADGLGFGANTRAALITRGLAEMMRLSAALGGKRETLMGLAGLGDLVLTCTDNQSRNRRLGLRLGEGQSLEQARASIDQVIEGIQAACEVYELAREYDIDMPISEQVYQVIHQGCAPTLAVESLLNREQKTETE